MRRALLLYNPASGKWRNRVQTVERVAAVLCEQSVDVNLCATEGPGTAGRQAAEAADYVDFVFACGGDGTVHEVIQGIAFHPRVKLGIIPTGSANVVARHLELPIEPVRDEAVLRAIRQKTRAVMNFYLGLRPRLV